MISGVASDAGDAWDFCKYWRIDGQHLFAHDDYGNSERCLYSFTTDRQTLTLRHCPSAGDWQRKAELTQAKRGSWTCRMQVYYGPEE